MKPSFRHIQPFADAIARLLHPFAEVVLHDLETDSIQAIYNSFSRREVGDPSYLERVDFDTSQEVIGPYAKTNWDGRSLKSISIVIRNQKGDAEGFLCINVDVSAFESAKSMLQCFLSNNAEMAEDTQSLFKDDLYEKINLYVQSYCRDKHVSLDALSKGEKREIVHALIANGAFKGRNASSYIARILGVSRATVYNYSKEEV